MRLKPSISLHLALPSVHLSDFGEFSYLDPMASEEQKNEQQRSDTYKIKKVNFFDRKVPIILQNENGPCPLLAICNVLSLRNNLDLGVDVPDISQQRLLHIIAERLLDANNDAENKDAGYLKNQLQNIADAIELVPSLATGIDVNVRFRNIHDFEFTPVCAIFDLLNIDLVHGWILDPQDIDTASAIGSNSYNTLMEKLVALEATNIHQKGISVEDCVDFAAATTATLGVPSPCLSKVRSFEDPPVVIALHQSRTEEDSVEETNQLMKGLTLSKADVSTTVDEYVPADANLLPSVNPNGMGGLISECEGIFKFQEEPKSSELHSSIETVEHKHEENNTFSTSTNGECLLATLCEEGTSLSYDTSHKTDIGTSPGHVSSGCLEEKNTSHTFEQEEPFAFPDSSVASPSRGTHGSNTYNPMEGEHFLRNVPGDALNTFAENYESKLINSTTIASDINADFVVTDGDHEVVHISIDTSSSLDGSEPIYEGEDVVQDVVPTICEDPEPMYEGEVVLATQTDRDKQDGCGSQSIDNSKLCYEPHPLVARKGDLIQQFLMSHASQLTIYGLFCLQEHLKEHTLGVFFRNNHFSTIFKHQGQLYLLATDQGYINQPDLVWEKLNEVNGDTVFMTGNFEEFKVGNDSDITSWDEQNAMNNTAEYLASVDNAALSDASMSSDLQLAIALQQQELESRPQRNDSETSPQPSILGASRLVTGPEVRRGSAPLPPRLEAKSKEKCVVM